MATRKTYKLVITWQHKNLGPQMQKVTAEGTSIRRAIANGLMGFFSTTGDVHKFRRDAHGEVTVSARRLKKEAAQ